MSKFVILHLVEFPDSVLSHALESRKANLGFMMGSIDDYKFRSTYIGKNRYGVLLRRDNPLARNGEISLKDLSQFPIAVKGKEYNIYDLHINKFIMKNIYPQVELECSDDSFLFEFVSRNHGGAVIMDFQVKQKTFIKYMEEYDLVFCFGEVK